MKVKEICTRTVRTYTPETRLSDAGWSMWESDCGILPVVDEAGNVVGVITDRDICMSTSTKYRPAAEIAVREAFSGKMLTCGGKVRARPGVPMLLDLEWVGSFPQVRGNFRCDDSFPMFLSLSCPEEPGPSGIVASAHPAGLRIATRIAEKAGEEVPHDLRSAEDALHASAVLRQEPGQAGS